MDDAHAQLKDEEARRVVAVQTLAIVEKRIKDLVTKLARADRERKCAEAALAGVEKQAENQCLQLRKVEEQFAVAKEQIEAQKKEIKKVEEATTWAEQNGYDIGVKETKDILRAQVTRVC